MDPTIHFYTLLNKLIPHLAVWSGYHAANYRWYHGPVTALALPIFDLWLKLHWKGIDQKLI